RTAATVAGGLGMDYRAGLMPQDKLTAIRDMDRAAGPVMMVGDGINDAPALKQARVGVAMGSGTDVALETADAAILRDRVTDVPALIALARATMGNIRQNVAIALGLKAVFLITTIIGITGLWIAILADTGATVLVTLNALRLLRRRRAGPGSAKGRPPPPRFTADSAGSPPDRRRRGCRPGAPPARLPRGQRRGRRWRPRRRKRRHHRFRQR